MAETFVHCLFDDNSKMPFVSTLQIAEEIRHILDNYDKAVPSVLEIPSKDFPYDSSKDSILKRAKVSSCFVLRCKFKQILIYIGKNE